MITIGFSTRQIDKDFIEHLKKFSGLKNVEIIPFENKGTHSLTEAYNEILNKASHDIVILCHDDIYFDKVGFGSRIKKHFNKNPEYGIIGVAGTKYLAKTGRWWDIQTEMIGVVNHESDNKKWTSKYSEGISNKLEPVVLVDGLFMAVHKNRLNNTFNQDVQGFHFYDVDFCFENFLNGVNIGVCFDVRVTHKSVGVTNQDWENNRKLFIEKYSENLPQILPTEFKVKRVKDKEPLVSIIMPIYNYAKRLNPTLNSIFKQNYTNFEVVIVNDGSIDEYCNLKLDTLKHHDRIRVINNEKNSGAAHSRNVGVQNSKGDYILPLDADDMILPEYIGMCVSIINNNENVSPVYCDTHHVGEMRGVDKRPEWSKERLLAGPFIVNSSMYTREAYEKTEGYNEDMDAWEDYDFWVQMMDAGYVGKRIPKPLFIYFHHESEGTVSTVAKTKTGELKKIIIDRHKQRVNEVN